MSYTIIIKNILKHNEKFIIFVLETELFCTKIRFKASTPSNLIHKRKTNIKENNICENSWLQDSAR